MCRGREKEVWSEGSYEQREAGSGRCGEKTAVRRGRERVGLGRELFVFRETDGEVW